MCDPNLRTAETQTPAMVTENGRKAWARPPAKGALPRKTWQGASRRQSCAPSALGLRPGSSPPTSCGSFHGPRSFRPRLPSRVPGPRRPLLLPSWTENDGAARPPGSQRPMTLTGRGDVGSLLHLSSRAPGVTASPASMFWRESPARPPGTCSMSKKRATDGLSCGCRRVWLLSKPLGPWTIGQSISPLLGMQIPGPRGRPAEPNNLGEAPSSVL